MLLNIGLNENERIIEVYEGICDSKGNDGNLYLTSESIVFSHETGFITTKQKLFKIRFKDVVIIDDKIQIYYDEEEDGIAIRYSGGQEEFCFEDEESARNFMQKIIDEIIKNKSRNEYDKRADFLHCSKCGKQVNKDDKFCSRCGTDLKNGKINDDQITNLLKKGADKVDEMFKNKKSNKCRNCGATLNGIIGSFVKCEYCGNEQIIM